MSFNKKNIWLIGYMLFSACILTILLTMQLYHTTPKIGIVQSDIVLQKYSGFVEARDMYEAKIEQYKESFEKQKELYESKKSELDLLSTSLKGDALVKKEKEVEGMKLTLLKLGAQIEEHSKDKEAEIINSVYTKVNDFITRYGQNEGYDVILGATGNGNVVYSSTPVDLTEDVIEKLNKEYQNGI